ncbi:MAG: ABC transporter substrate-binding protein [Lachnospiraceae bacterium]|nr:ABC transporter substrate-binding protein [Lachnospiraceae bacterium]
MNRHRPGKSIYIVLTFLLCILCACGGKSDQTGSETGEAVDEITEEEDKGLISVGFSQIGAESDWRNINTASMKEALSAENGYDLSYSDGQQKQQNQITAIRTFIQKEVDYIVLAPVVEDGWDTVLCEAKDASIPVIIVDRMVNVDDSGLFSCWVGSDFEMEGVKVCEWINEYCKAKGIEGSEINIVNIMGTEGASAEIGRTKALREAVSEYGWNLLGEESGDFTVAKGRAVMTKFLREHDNINVVYCENDNEAFGAIEAIETAGRKVGSNIKDGEIMVVAFDGACDQAIEEVISGRISCIGECNPLHGPRVSKIIRNLESGIIPDKYEYVEEGLISADDTVKTVFAGGKPCEVNIIEK